MPRQRHKSAVTLPKGVHRVISRGREYFYYQAGRGTDHHGPRVALPNDPHSPEFWNAIRQAQGIVGSVPRDTINALADAYQTAWPSLPRKLTDGTKEQYKRSLGVVRAAWGDLRAAALRPSHVQALMDGLAHKPGKANNVLDALRAMCRWAMGPRELLSRDPTLGVAHFAAGEGHKPWTPAQLKNADEFTGALRRWYFLSRYTGQRISDVVRLGFTDVDDVLRCVKKKPACVRGVRFSRNSKPRWLRGRSDRARSLFRRTESHSAQISFGNSSTRRERNTRNCVMRCRMVCVRTPSFTFASPATRSRRSATWSACRLRWLNATAATLIARPAGRQCCSR